MKRHNIRLRHGLAIADWDRLVFVGERPHSWGHELLPWRFAHGLQHRRVLDTAIRYLIANHLGALEVVSLRTCNQRSGH